MREIQSARLAMASDNAYQDIMTELSSQLNEIEVGKEKIINESWSELKKIGRG
jgi:hypothetical protein